MPRGDMTYTDVVRQPLLHNPMLDAHPAQHRASPATLLEGALTGSDFFECARDSTETPVAAWMVSFVYVMLTAVLLLNMLIAMCAQPHEPHSAMHPFCPRSHCVQLHSKHGKVAPQMAFH